MFSSLHPPHPTARSVLSLFIKLPFNFFSFLARTSKSNSSHVLPNVENQQRRNSVSSGTQQHMRFILDLENIAFCVHTYSLSELFYFYSAWAFTSPSATATPNKIFINEMLIFFLLASINLSWKRWRNTKLFTVCWFLMWDFTCCWLFTFHLECWMLQVSV